MREERIRQVHPLCAGLGLGLEAHSEGLEGMKSA